MLIASGTLLVLLTWCFAGIVIIGLGSVPAMLLSMRSVTPVQGFYFVRTAMWWGLPIAAGTVMLLNQFWSLHSLPAGLFFLGFFLLSVAISAPLIFRLKLKWKRPGFSRSAMALWVALLGAVLFLAIAALGPVTNYDSGLYHLGAVRYASDYPAIPGISNLYFALGYGNAEFPLAAFFGNGPWQLDGFRLLNGFVIVLAVADLWLRGRRRPTLGFLVLLSGIVVALVPMIALSDYWVTSPTQDSFIFIVTVVTSSYIVDGVTLRNWVTPMATALMLAVALILLRPTMIVFAGGIVVVALVMARKRLRQTERGTVAVAASLVLLVGLGAGLVSAIRDYTLSGWLQYPLSVFSFDVPWRAEDPSMFRDATLGYHRDPARMWDSVHGWGWVKPWLASRLTQWETYEWVALLCAVLVVSAGVVLSRGVMRWRAAALSTLPSFLALIFWWLATPPSYRFAWGLMFTVLTIPLGFALHALLIRGGRPQEVLFLLCALLILAVTGFTAVARFDWQSVTRESSWNLGVSIPYAVTPVIEVPVQQQRMATGLNLLIPTQSDQCWMNYPLCTPTPSQGLQMRGTQLQDGFLP